jgi:ATP-dependent helicase/nuclease subunit A
MIRRGIEENIGPGTVMERPYGPVTLWREGGEAAGPAAATIPASAAEAVPSWLEVPLPEEAEAAPPLSPSGALGAADPRREPGRRLGDAQARRRGVLIHALIEHLPRLDPRHRKAAATRFVRARAPTLDAATQKAIVAATMRLFDHPDLAALFAPDARAEVTLSGRVVVDGAERPVFGRVDRLAIGPETVVVADFKTGRPPAEDVALPEAETRQIALYAALLTRIFPGRRIVPMLVWTSGPTVRRLTEGERAAALGPIAA